MGGPEIVTPKLSVTVERLQSEAEVSYSDILEHARKALKVEENPFCGEMEYVLEDYSGMLSLDKKLETLKVKPNDSPVSIYTESFLRFYYIDNPELSLSV